MSCCGDKRTDTRPPVPIEQFLFWDGQTLRSADLNGYVGVGDARRWWHNRALHNAYGVGVGFEVSAAALNAAQPNQINGVRVRAGIAYDCFGRMLHHPFDRDVPFPSDVPDSVAAVVLVLRWRDRDPELCCCSPSPKCCLGEPAYMGDNVEVYWKEGSQVRGPDGVPIARALYAKDAKNTPPSLDNTFRAPRLRRFARPHIAADGTLPGATGWTLGPSDLIRPDPSLTSISWQPVDVDIDTSAAGFAQTPQYFAQISGSLFDPALELVLPVAYPHVVNEFPDQFTFRFWIPIESGQGARLREASAAATSASPDSVIGFEAFREFARRQKLRVVWLGCDTPFRGLPEEFKRQRNLCGCGTRATPLNR